MGRNLLCIGLCKFNIHTLNTFQLKRKYFDDICIHNVYYVNDLQTGVVHIMSSGNNFSLHANFKKYFGIFRRKGNFEKITELIWTVHDLKEQNLHPRA